VKLFVERDGQDRALRMAKHMFASHFNASKKDKAILELKEDSLTRTQRQNKLYWLWLNVYYKDTGNRQDAMHEYFAKNFIGGEMKEIDLLGEKVRVMVVKSTTQLTTAEFKDYLEQIQDFMNEQGIKLPTPKDLYWQSMGVIE
jgi:hypothetical protein